MLKVTACEIFISKGCHGNTILIKKKSQIKFNTSVDESKMVL